MSSTFRFLTGGPLSEMLFYDYARRMQEKHQTVALVDNLEGVSMFVAGQDAAIHAERQIPQQKGEWNLWVTKAPCLHCIQHMLANVGYPGLFVCHIPVPTSKWFQSSSLAIQALRKNGYIQVETPYPLVVLRHGGNQVLSWD